MLCDIRQDLCLLWASVSLLYHTRLGRPQCFLNINMPGSHQGIWLGADVHLVGLGWDLSSALLTHAQTVLTGHTGHIRKLAHFGFSSPTSPRLNHSLSRNMFITPPTHPRFSPPEPG